MAFRHRLFFFQCFWCLGEGSCFWCCEKVEYYQQLINFYYHIFHNGEDPSSLLDVKLESITPRKVIWNYPGANGEICDFVCLFVCLCVKDQLGTGTWENLPGVLFGWW